MPHAKFIGDLGNATTAIRIGDPRALQVLAKNSDRCNFRLFQQYPPGTDHAAYFLMVTAAFDPEPPAGAELLT